MAGGGPGCGPADVSGKGLARGLVSVPGKDLAGVCVFWFSSSIVCPWSLQRSACHHAGASRALVPMLSMVSELLGSRVAALLVLGKLPRQGSCRGCGGRPGKGLAGGVHLTPLLFVFLAWRCSGRLVPLRPLPRQAWPGAWGCDCPRTSKGVQKGTSTFVHRQEPPGLGHI